jgi:YfiH family protein
MSDFIFPAWPAPARVRALTTTRRGGVSVGPYRDFNLGAHVGDDPGAVAENRRRLRTALPAEPVWLSQVHGTRCVRAESTLPGAEADACVTREPGRVCAVMTADCLPVLLCDRAGTVVGIAHAGWRGLLAGVIEATAAAMEAAPGELLAWLGPAIGPAAFEVGEEVRTAFAAVDPAAAAAFAPRGNGKWLADIYALARLRLSALGVASVHGGGFCTVTDADRLFSYRRDGTTGRMASLIWLAP